MKYLALLIPVIVIACGLLIVSGARQYTTIRNEALPQVAMASDLSADARACLERPSVRGAALPHEGIKPAFLSGDFDGDGNTDIAVVIRGPRTGRNGVLICTARQTTLLGADQPLHPPFSDMPHDNFVSSQWDIFSKTDVADVHRFVNGRRVQAAFPLGDSIAMIWEDSVCLIYSDGTHYRWVCGD
jgi:hypothetical protein